MGQAVPLVSRSAPPRPACRTCGWRFVRPAPSPAQPRIDAAALTLMIGVEAETRIVPSETKPDCPFPGHTGARAAARAGRVNIAVPIDVPFTEVNRLLAAQLTGKTFPQDGSGVSRPRSAAANIAPPGTGC